MLKAYFLLFWLLIGFEISAQDSIKLHAETPKIIRNLQLGDTLSIKNYQVRFLEVIRDSRCPKGVNCITYGEAIILLNIQKDGEFLESKQIEISPKHYMDETTKIIELDSQDIYVIGLKPFPIYNKKTNSNDYCLQLLPEKRK